MINPQKFCVKWNSYSTNFQTCFPRLRNAEHFADITLACEGQMIKCHKVVLSACSLYFERLLVANPCQHPIVFMKDMKHWEIQALVDFMYKGEVNVSQDELNSLLIAAEALQIRGLCGSENPNGVDSNSVDTVEPETVEPEPRLPKGTVVSAPPLKRRREEKVKATVKTQPAVKKTREKGNEDGDEDSLDLAELQQRMVKEEQETVDDNYLSQDNHDDDYDPQDDSDAGSADQTRPGPSGSQSRNNGPKEKNGAAQIPKPIVKKPAPKRKRGRPRSVHERVKDDVVNHEEESSSGTTNDCVKESGEEKPSDVNAEEKTNGAKRKRGRPRQSTTDAPKVEDEAKENCHEMEVDEVTPGDDTSKAIADVDASGEAVKNSDKNAVNDESKTKANPNSADEEYEKSNSAKRKRGRPKQITSDAAKTDEPKDNSNNVEEEATNSDDTLKAPESSNDSETEDSVEMNSMVRNYRSTSSNRWISSSGVQSMIQRSSSLTSAEISFIYSFVNGSRVNPWKDVSNIVTFKLDEFPATSIQTGQSKTLMKIEKLFEINFETEESYKVKRARRVEERDRKFDDIKTIKYDGAMNERKVTTMCEESDLSAAEKAVITNFVCGNKTNPWEYSCEVVSFVLGSTEVSGIRGKEGKKCIMRAERIFEMEYGKKFTREIVRIRRDELAES